MKRFLPLFVLLVSCKTVPPEVIGTGTRQEIKRAEQAVEAVQAEAKQIDGIVKEVSVDLNVLEMKVPVEMRSEVKAIGEKVRNLSLLTETHAETTVPEQGKALADVEKSFENDMHEVAAVSQELNKSREKLASTKSQRNTLAAILLMLSAIAVMMLLARRFIPKLPLS